MVKAYIIQLSTHGTDYDHNNMVMQGLSGLQLLTLSLQLLGQGCSHWHGPQLSLVGLQGLLSWHSLPLSTSILQASQHIAIGQVTPLLDREITPTWMLSRPTQVRDSFCHFKIIFSFDSKPDVHDVAGGRKVMLCGLIQYINLFGIAIGYTIAASVSMM